MLRRIGTYGVCAFGFLLWSEGCSAVLGIEDLGSEAPLGSAGSSGGGSENGGSSGADASMGGKSTGGRLSGTGNVSGGGGTATGGRNNGGVGGITLPDGSVPDADGSAGAGGLGNGGAGGVSNGGAGGNKGGAGGTTGGAGGATGGAGGQNTGGGGATGSTVTGKVIDYWRHPVPNVFISINGDTTTTNPSGAFTVNNVAATYDVALVASYGSTSAGWIFQGLTRRDPTLQIEQGFDYHNADTYATSTGVTFPLTNQAIGYGFGSPEGNFMGTITESPDNLYYVYYYGPATSAGGSHALRWTVDPVTLFPVLYKGYGYASVTMVQSPTPVNFTLALGDNANVSTGTLSGSVATSATTRENHVYARFADHAAIEVITDTAPAGNFSYKVPAIANANMSLTVAAVDGSLGYFPIAIAHKDGLAGGQSGVSLTIPAGQSLSTPIDSATGVNASTTFRWSGSAGVSTFTIYIDPFNTSNSMHVVTTAKTASLPAFTDASYTVPAATSCEWFVETHGTYATVDDAAGPTGYIDTFSHHAPEGPKTGDGSYTETIHRTFTSQ